MKITELAKVVKKNERTIYKDIQKGRIDKVGPNLICNNQKLHDYIKGEDSTKKYNATYSAISSLGDPLLDAKQREMRELHDEKNNNQRNILWIDEVEGDSTLEDKKKLIWQSIKIGLKTYREDARWVTAAMKYVQMEEKSKETVKSTVQKTTEEFAEEFYGPVG